MHEKVARALGLAFSLLVAVLAFSPEAQPGTFELSFGGSFTSSDYGGGSFSWTRRLGGSVGYYFFQVTEVEVSFQDSFDQTKIMGFQDTTTHDMLIGASIVQTLVPKSFPIQPYVKAGGGQLIREAKGTYANGAAPPALVGSLSVILGVGLRIYITQNFAIRGEGVSYLTGGAINTWKDNFGITGGVSLLF